jgi:threonine dehydrogenase-like Zn-dependent dehydrogenase
VAAASQRAAVALPKRWVPQILPLLEGDEDAFGLGDFVSHRLALDDAPTAYTNFQAKQYQTIKVVLQS